ncbi:MAG: CoA transferase [Coriobacteriales bacterium]|jgi:L-carnitine CoA-transferase|nr:CoA transferase [Coriobacteriales bacterium]
MKSSEMPKFGNLQSLKVLNAAAVIAGPFVCELFAEQGADVIELESTIASDMYRMYGDAWSVDRRNQRMMSLNIPSPEGREVLLDLVKDADILVESSKGGTWKKWGITDEVLWEANPSLVILHISGFGNWGDPAYVNRASFDPIGQAFSGYAQLNGFPDSPPSITKPFTGDFMTGMMGAWACLAAVIRARETGEGESIDCCQFESLVRLQGATLSDGINHDIQPPRLGNEDLVGACAGSQKCKDGYCQVAVGGAGPVRKLVEFFGFADDPDFQPLGSYPSITRAPGTKSLDEHLPDRASKFRAKLDAWCEEHTVEEVDQLFSEMGVAVSPHMTYTRMLENPHYVAREVFIDCYDEITGKTIKQVNMMPRFKNHPGQIIRGGAKYGADTDDILEELGYSKERISELYEKCILKEGQ